MSVPKPVVIDFETWKIERRPAYPPRSVGVSIKEFGRPAKYFGYGHPEGNNCTQAQVRARLHDALRHKDGILCQNGKFDTDVIETEFGLRLPPPEKVHDTMFLMFLSDPHALSLSLRPFCEHRFDLPAGEKNEVGEWLIKHWEEIGLEKKPTKKTFGAFISLAPADLVGRRAIGDVERTELVFQNLYQEVCIDRGMLEPYQREQRLMPVLLKIERQGIRVDHQRLAKETAYYNKVLRGIDAFLRRETGDDSFNIDSGEQLMEVLIRSKLANPRLIPRTKTRKWKSSADVLEKAILDPALFRLLKYRGQLMTYVHTFMEPWLAMADASDGLIFTQWHQTRGGDEKFMVGARTGRLSSSPNFQNIPTREYDYFSDPTSSPRRLLPKLPELPRCREYVVPYSPGHILIDRDYSQQEPRILGHFENAALLAQYQADPWTDVHDNARDRLQEMTGRDWGRRPVKDTNLGLIYGMGVKKLAAKSGISQDDAYQLKTLIMEEIYPGIGTMYEDMKERAEHDEPIRTWGGREYYCEPPKIIDRRLREFDYKLLNTLIQGSAGDCTKEAIIRYDAAKPSEDLLLLTVHDELLGSTPKKRGNVAMAVLKEVMESIEFDVPMLTEGTISFKNWGQMIEYDKKGKRVNHEKLSS